jgi:ribosomal protein L37E
MEFDLTLLLFRPLKPLDLYYNCRRCGMKSPHVYVQGWTCLNPVCSEFWNVGSKDSALLDLKYNERFLELQPISSPVGLDQDLRPRLPTQNPTDGINTTYTFTRGWHCRNCGRLSTRYSIPHLFSPTQRLTLISEVQVGVL